MWWIHLTKHINLGMVPIQPQKDAIGYSLITIGASWNYYGPWLLRMELTSYHMAASGFIEMLGVLSDGWFKDVEGL